MVARTLAELSEVVSSPGPFRIVGSASHGVANGGEELRIGITGIEDFSAAEMVATVAAGTAMAELNFELSGHGLCVPVSGAGTLGGSIAMNAAGNWRDWVLGMTVVRSDGTIAKCGSRVVKSVAGYDLHRFLVGSRGVFGVIASATLRLYSVDRDFSNEQNPKRTYNEAEHALLLRAKAIFDPENKLNPGALEAMLE